MVSGSIQNVIESSAGLRDRMVSLKKTLSVAESCTGGLLSNIITLVSGASNYFMGGCITYSEASKTTLLGVSPESLEVHGAVSAIVAEEMARGMRDKLQTDFAVSITGIAGPDGGSAEKPVGTFFVGLSSAAHTFSIESHFRGTRTEIQSFAAMTAIRMLKEELASLSK